MHLASIPHNTPLGRLVRLPLRAIPKGTTVRILGGPTRGMRWIVDSAPHACWLGVYERDWRVVFERTVTAGSTVFDLGAHVGFYTLLASVLVGPEGRVFAFEPMPANEAYLRQHLRLNHITNVTVVAAAVSDRSGLAHFEPGPSTVCGRLSANGPLEVPTVSLDDLVAAGEVPSPDFIKIDVEGAELAVLDGARRLMGETHPTLFVSTHNRDIHPKCCRVLRSLGYDVQATGVQSVDEMPYGQIVARIPARTR